MIGGPFPDTGSHAGSVLVLIPSGVAKTLAFRLVRFESAKGPTVPTGQRKYVQRFCEEARELAFFFFFFLHETAPVGGSWICLNITAVDASDVAD